MPTRITPARLLFHQTIPSPGSSPARFQPRAFMPFLSKRGEAGAPCREGGGGQIHNTIAEPPETTDLIRFCPPLHPFVSERASYGKVAQMVFSWGRASANNYLDSHRPREGRVFTYSQVLAGLGMCSTERFVLSSRRILLFDRCIACPSAFPTRSSCC